MGLGYIGIAFLMSEQKRKNMLIRMDIDSKVDTIDKNRSSDSSISSSKTNNATNGRENQKQSKTKKSSDGAIVNDDTYDRSRKFRRSAPTFILLSVLPYMFQIIVFGKCALKRMP
jgi:UDP-N-acetyl-D-mannosaminuronate dehydrogenase